MPTTLDSWTTRCGFGQRLPLLVISPWTRQNYVSGNLTNTVSITKFIEDNWLRGQRIGGGSYDTISGSLYARGGLLNFRTRPNFRPVILDPTTGRSSAASRRQADGEREPLGKAPLEASAGKQRRAPRRRAGQQSAPEASGKTEHVARSFGIIGLIKDVGSMKP